MRYPATTRSARDRGLRGPEQLARALLQEDVLLRLADPQRLGSRLVSGGRAVRRDQGVRQNEQGLGELVRCISALGVGNRVLRRLYGCPMVSARQREARPRTRLPEERVDVVGRDAGDSALDLRARVLEAPKRDQG